MESTLQALDLEPGGTLHVRSLHLLDWGQVLRLACVYRRPDHADQPLDLSFHDCREMKWRIYAFDDDRDEVLIVDARLGRGSHRSPAHMLTDRFGVTVFYGELQVTQPD